MQLTNDKAISVSRVKSNVISQRSLARDKEKVDVLLAYLIHYHKRA